MSRSFCLEFPVAPSTPSISIPGIGPVQAVRNFSLESYNVCSDARAMIQLMQPMLGAMGMPLCILGCLTSVTQVFSSDFPYINPAKLAKIPQNCACLTGFTPFAFCGMIRGVISIISSSLTCIVGMLGDLVRMEAQAASLLAHPETAFQGQCLHNQANVLNQNMLKQFNPVIQIHNAATFLFSFVGIPVSQIEEVSGSSSAETLQALAVVQQSIQTVATAINNICPG